MKFGHVVLDMPADRQTYRLTCTHIATPRTHIGGEVIITIRHDKNKSRPTTSKAVLLNVWVATQTWVAMVPKMGCKGTHQISEQCLLSKNQTKFSLAFCILSMSYDNKVLFTYLLTWYLMMSGSVSRSFYMPHSVQPSRRFLKLFILQAQAPCGMRWK